MTSPDPAATKWVPIWNGGSGAGQQIPAPVNGQWLKGQGGAAVWQPWTTADLDAAFVAAGQTHRLGPNAVANISDWNSAVSNGWYTALSAANSPGGNAAFGAPGWLLGFVVDHNSSWPTQEVWAFTESPPRRWRRYCINTSWLPWQLLDAPWANIGSMGWAGGFGDYGSPWGPARFCKRAGVVICEGLVSVTGDAGAYAWTLPVDYRTSPGRQMIFHTAAQNTQPETWRIDDAGGVRCSTGPQNWVTLTGVSFYAEA
jgi:hypothetical protein